MSTRVYQQDWLTHGKCDLNAGERKRKYCQKDSTDYFYQTGGDTVSGKTAEGPVVAVQEGVKAEGGSVGFRM